MQVSVSFPYLTPHLVVGLVLQVADTEKYPHLLGLKSLDSFFRAIQQASCFTAAGEDGGDKRLVELELACKADGIAPPASVQSGHRCHR